MSINTKRRRSVMAISIAAAASVVMAGCTPARAAGPSIDAAEPIEVTVAAAAIADVADAIDAGGIVQARTTAVITARLLAPVLEVRVLPGDRVRKGQTLVVLDTDDLAAADRAAESAVTAARHGATAAAAELQAAEAALELAQASHDRVASLQARGSATAQELDEATAALKGAEARVTGASARSLQATSAVDSARAASDRARATKGFGTIAAPFDGVITEKMVEPGNMASPGTPLLRVEDTTAFRLEVQVDESRAVGIRTGVRLPVSLGTAASAFDGTVGEVSRAVDADARAFVVKIALPALPGARSGEFGRARFQNAPRRGLTVPASAIVRQGQLTSVFVVENGRARVRLVNVRESEVVAGLAEAELVVLSPPAGLVDGRPVTVGGR